MIKVIENETLALMRERRSTRVFKGSAPDAQTLEALAAAGMQAPYAQNDSRAFTALSDAALLCEIGEAAKKEALKTGIPHLAELARDPSFSPLYGAPSAMIISCRRGAVAGDQDCAAAAQNILIAAQSLGLSSCWIFFATLAFTPEDAYGLRTRLGIPDDYNPHIFIALGCGIPDKSDRSAPAQHYNTVG